ncbi:DUF3828 domain-containing protein [Roseomonas genomospecies 6]|uniref:DUF3828 domain-containing protein n=1 Tax=Roseomonas genomospecies 6 TaxID=214106 RepID=A0A9W7KNL9_9PROT|nr:DUF3828 domain-containing protein [Roseomonas genomospecies 6]KAA0675704.1 DUF3828 domain-containing protein [Roseomonas genomospecies 6]
MAHILHRILLTTALALLAPTAIAAPPAAADDAAAAASAFYSWYVEGVENTARFPDAAADQRTLKQRVTEALLKNRKAIIARTGADPFILAQDTGSDWTGAVSAHTVRGTADAAEVQVVLGQQAPHVLKVTMKRIDGIWRIDRVDLGR